MKPMFGPMVALVHGKVVGVNMSCSCFGQAGVTRVRRNSKVPLSYRSGEKRRDNRLFAHWDFYNSCAQRELQTRFFWLPCFPLYFFSCRFARVAFVGHAFQILVVCLSCRFAARSLCRHAFGFLLLACLVSFFLLLAS